MHGALKYTAEQLTPPLKQAKNICRLVVCPAMSKFSQKVWESAYQRIWSRPHYKTAVAQTQAATQADSTLQRTCETSEVHGWAHRASVQCVLQTTTFSELNAVTLAPNPSTLAQCSQPLRSCLQPLCRRAVQHQHALAPSLYPLAKGQPLLRPLSEESVVQ